VVLAAAAAGADGTCLSSPPTKKRPTEFFMRLKMPSSRLSAVDANRLADPVAFDARAGAGAGFDSADAVA